MTKASQPATAVATTGIVGLDSILAGGLPRNRIFLVKGNPGVGKTTLGLQFLLDGLRKGEKGLYLTLSESAAEIQSVAESHGWAIADVHVFEWRPPDGEDATDEDEQYTVFHPAEVELSAAMKTLLAEVDRLNPARVVLDSLSEVRLLSQSLLQFRRQILALKHHFIGRKTTVILLDDMTTDADSQLESIAHGVISLEKSNPVHGAARRRVCVDKMRGVNYRTGYHDFAIERGGIAVFPRLEAFGGGAAEKVHAVSSGVREVDGILGGGLPSGASLLILGPPGAGKSALMNQFAVTAARRGDRACIYTFDETRATLLARAASLGMAFGEHIEAGTIHVQQVDPAEMGPGEFMHRVREQVERTSPAIIGIDSLNGFLQAMPDERSILAQLHELFGYLNHRGVCGILVATQQGLIGPAMTSPIDVSYLADVVILLRYFESNAEVRRAISVMKQRTGAHERTIREFALGSAGIHIGQPLREFHGILTGVPTYTGGRDPLLGEPRE
jgi:circadian clock protein KaiC